MPCYEYECKSCSFRFEETQRISDEPLLECPKCKEHALKRLISIGMCDVKYDAKELYENVLKPEAKEIANKIRNGDENEAANFFGEDFVNSGQHRDLIKRQK